MPIEPTSTNSLRDVLLEGDPLDCEETLRILKIALDSIILSIATGEAVTYLEIRNRRVQFSDPTKMMSALQNMIVYYTNCVASSNSSLSRRNVAVFRGR